MGMKRYRSFQNCALVKYLVVSRPANHSAPYSSKFLRKFELRQVNLGSVPVDRQSTPVFLLYHLFAKSQINSRYASVQLEGVPWSISVMNMTWPKCMEAFVPTEKISKNRGGKLHGNTLDW